MFTYAIKYYNFIQILVLCLKIMKINYYLKFTCSEQFGWHLKVQNQKFWWQKSYEFLYYVLQIMKHNIHTKLRFYGHLKFLKWTEFDAGTEDFADLGLLVMVRFEDLTVRTMHAAEIFGNYNFVNFQNKFLFTESVNYLLWTNLILCVFLFYKLLTFKYD